MFQSILIPVDFSINTKVAINKALLLAEKGSSIHLFHIQSYPSATIADIAYSYLSSRQASAEKMEIDERLNDLCKEVSQERGNVYVFSSHTLADSIQHAIVEKAREIRADLVIIGKHTMHSWFPFLNTVVPGRIASQLGIPVLTVKPGAMHNGIKTVVVPITSPETKQITDLIYFICQKFKSRIHLVTFMNDGNTMADPAVSALLKTYQWLKMSIHCPVEYALLDGNNHTNAIIEYAEKTNADILLVNPETENKTGWLSRRISDLLPPESRIQILAVSKSA